MSLKKPSSEEEEYFAKEQAARLHALAVEKQAQLAEEEREALKKQHWMHCPKCGFTLDTVQFHGVAIDRCFHCGGTFLDAGELEQLAGKDAGGGILQSIQSLFRHTPRATGE
jgi:Zn-finger nucleic acid-binding protein